MRWRLSAGVRAACSRREGLEVDAAAVLLPVAVTRGIGTFSAADLAWSRRRLFRNGNEDLLRLGHGRRLTYHLRIHSRSSVRPAANVGQPAGFPRPVLPPRFRRTGLARRR